MILDPAACEWYKLAIVTSPATTPTDWEASIDGGQTYATAEDIDGNSAWLVAGPDYVPGPPATFTTALGKTYVKVRLVDNPETVIQGAPRIVTKLL